MDEGNASAELQLAIAAPQDPPTTKKIRDDEDGFSVDDHRNNHKPVIAEVARVLVSDQDEEVQRVFSAGVLHSASDEAAALQAVRQRRASRRTREDDMRRDISQWTREAEAASETMHHVRTLVFDDLRSAHESLAQISSKKNDEPVVGMRKIDESEARQDQDIAAPPAVVLDEPKNSTESQACEISHKVRDLADRVAMSRQLLLIRQGAGKRRAAHIAALFDLRKVSDRLRRELAFAKDEAQRVSIAADRTELDLCNIRSQAQVDAERANALRAQTIALQNKKIEATRRVEELRDREISLSRELAAQEAEISRQQTRDWNRARAEVIVLESTCREAHEKACASWLNIIAIAEKSSATGTELKLLQQVEIECLRVLEPISEGHVERLLDQVDACMTLEHDLADLLAAARQDCECTDMFESSPTEDLRHTVLPKLLEDLVAGRAELEAAQQRVEIASAAVERGTRLEALLCSISAGAGAVHHDDVSDELLVGNGTILLAERATSLEKQLMSLATELDQILRQQLLFDDVGVVQAFHQLEQDLQILQHRCETIQGEVNQIQGQISLLFAMAEKRRQERDEFLRSEKLLETSIHSLREQVDETQSLLLDDAEDSETFLREKADFILLQRVHERELGERYRRKMFSASANHHRDAIAKGHRQLLLDVVACDEDRPEGRCNALDTTVEVVVVCGGDVTSRSTTEASGEPYGKISASAASSRTYKIRLPQTTAIVDAGPVADSTTSGGPLHSRDRWGFFSAAANVLGRFRWSLPWRNSRKIASDDLREVV